MVHGSGITIPHKRVEVRWVGDEESLNNKNEFSKDLIELKDFLDLSQNDDPERARIKPTWFRNSDPYIFEGVESIYILGCLIRQDNPQKINTTVTVPRYPSFPVIQGRPLAESYHDINLSDAYWTWELLHAPYESDTFRNPPDDIRQINLASSDDTSNGAMGYRYPQDLQQSMRDKMPKSLSALLTKFRGSLFEAAATIPHNNYFSRWAVAREASLPSIREKLMLERYEFVNQYHQSRSHVCATLVGPVMTEKSFLAMSELAEGISHKSPHTRVRVEYEPHITTASQFFKEFPKSSDASKGVAGLVTLGGVLVGLTQFAPHQVLATGTGAFVFVNQLLGTIKSRRDGKLGTAMGQIFTAGRDIVESPPLAEKVNETLRVPNHYRSLALAQLINSYIAQVSELESRIIMAKWLWEDALRSRQGKKRIWKKKGFDLFSEVEPQLDPQQNAAEGVLHKISEHALKRYINDHSKQREQENNLSKRISQTIGEWSVEYKRDAVAAVNIATRKVFNKAIFDFAYNPESFLRVVGLQIPSQGDLNSLIQTNHRLSILEIWSQFDIESRKDNQGAPQALHFSPLLYADEVTLPSKFSETGTGAEKRENRFYTFLNGLLMAYLRARPHPDNQNSTESKLEGSVMAIAQDVAATASSPKTLESLWSYRMEYIKSNENISNALTQEIEKFSGQDKNRCAGVRIETQDQVDCERIKNLVLRASWTLEKLDELDQLQTNVPEIPAGACNEVDGTLCQISSNSKQQFPKDKLKSRVTSLLFACEKLEQAQIGHGYFPLLCKLPISWVGIQKLEQYCAGKNLALESPDCLSVFNEEIVFFQNESSIWPGFTAYPLTLDSLKAESERIKSFTAP